MTIVVVPVTLPALTTATVAGTGVFDVLMRSMKAHLESEFTKNRIKGPEYATVYLGSMEAVLQGSLQFLLQKDKATLEAELVKAQIALSAQQLLNAQAELAILQQQLLKIPAEIAHLQAQTALVGQQKINLTAEALNIPKQGEMIDAQKNAAVQQTLKAVQETLQVVQQTNLTTKQVLQVEQQTINAVQERLVLIAQECKLKAEFDLLVLTKEKSEQEKQLLMWKVTTEKAQTLALGVDDNSVIGKQKSLYGAQTAGFTRDAEQKVAKLMVDTWNTRRMTDEGTIPGLSPLGGVDNGLGDGNIARAVTKLLAGVNA